MFASSFRMNYPRAKDPWVSSFTEPTLSLLTQEPEVVFSRGFNLGRPAPTRLLRCNPKSRMFLAGFDTLTTENMK